MVNVDHLESANDVAFFLDDSLGKIAAQKLTDIDPDGVAIGQRRVGSHRRIADHYRPIGFQDLQHADPLVVIAGNFQQHIAGRAGRKKDVVFLEQARVVRDQVFGFGSLELKPTAESARPTPEIGEIEFGVVMEDDAIVERSVAALPPPPFVDHDNAVAIESAQRSATPGTGGAAG